MVYYLNHPEIESKQSFLRWLAGAARQAHEASAASWDLMQALAQERILHLAIEAVTDLGNLLIDGFMMRDPSSYEDIIDVLKTENVVDAATADSLIELVRCRKALLQDYVRLDRETVHPLLAGLPDLLASFADQTAEYVKTNQL